MFLPRENRGPRSRQRYSGKPLTHRDQSLSYRFAKPTHTYSNTISIIDVDNTVVDELSVQGRAAGLVVNAATNKIYMSDSAGNEVYVIQGFRNSAGGLLRLVAMPATTSDCEGA